MNYKNEFNISKDRIERIKRFADFIACNSKIHNINKYWQKRIDNTHFKEVKKGIIIHNYSNLPDRIIYNKAYDFFLKRKFIRDFIKKIVDKIVLPITAKLKINESFKIIRKIKDSFYVKKGLLNAEKIFPYTTTPHIQNLLNSEPILSIVTSWPVRTTIMLRALNIIQHFSKNFKNPDKKLKVLEIGAGPCILVGLMMHKMDTKHIVVDLPTEIIIGFSFLSEFFPDKELVLPNEIREKGIPEEADVIFLTPEQIHLLKKEKIDIAVNMFSFQEMSYNAINEYFSFIRKCIKNQGILYCINRISKLNKEDNTISEFDKYSWSTSDKFLHDLIIDKELEGIEIAGGKIREVIVELKNE